ncbi:MAG: DUF3050 domain-containing protein [Myxococcales bacterium]|nr:DUF3050 domain-containing protein [Myxococcales bacterium]
MDRTQYLDALATEKQELADHDLYSVITSSPDVRRAIALFMERHVVCVLDFMSILKSLQRDLTCTRVPWVPARVGPLTRLINEIVLGEESDEVAPGRHLSHYEWYLEAMTEVGADTAPARALESALRAGVAPREALERSGLPREAIAFSAHTFALLEAPLATRAAVFFHAREDTIPRIFLPLVERLEASGRPCPTLIAYLRRHIELDGDEHGPAAERLLGELFAGDVAAERCALDAALGALRARARLWTSVAQALAPRAAEVATNAR